MTVLANLCTLVVMSSIQKKTAALKGMCIFKGFDTYFQISLQNVLPISTPTGSGAASGKHGCVRNGASGRRAESERELGGRSGLEGMINVLTFTLSKMGSIEGL